MNELPIRGAGASEPNDPLQPKECAEKLAALAAPERLKILRFLRDGPHNVGEIARMLDTEPVNVSHHLTVLKMAGLIRGEKRGRFIYYSLVPGILESDEAMAQLNLGCCQLTLPLAEKDEPRR